MAQRNREQLKKEIEEKREAKIELENQIRQLRKEHKLMKAKESGKSIKEQIYSLQERICRLEEEVWQTEE